MSSFCVSLRSATPAPPPSFYTGLVCIFKSLYKPPCATGGEAYVSKGQGRWAGLLRMPSFWWEAALRVGVERGAGETMRALGCVGVRSAGG